MSDSTKKSRRRIVVKNLEFLINFSHNVNEIKFFDEERKKLAELVKNSALATKVSLNVRKAPLPKSECHILVGEPGSNKDQKQPLTVGIAIKHKNDHNNRCVARSTAFDHAIDSKEFTEFLNKNGISPDEFRDEALNTLGLRYIKSEEAPVAAN